MTSNDKEYGVFIKNDLLKSVPKGHQQRTVLQGQVVIIDGKLRDSYVIRFLKGTETWESTQFFCSEDSIVRISDKLWMFIASIVSPIERVKLAKNKRLCDSLKSICKDIVVGFSDTEDIHLGKVKYIGLVKGMGYCYGIELHDKRRDNICNGSCAGIQYFECMPGHGVFTTIERIIPKMYSSVSSSSVDPTLSPRQTDLDLCLERNLNSISNGSNDSKPKYEEIVTKYGEYPKKLTMPSKSCTYMRNSLSLQNMLEMDNVTVNTNNDFDQNTIIQPERTQLFPEQRNVKNKSEMDLIDVIGGTWSGTTDRKHLEEFSNLKKNLDKNDNIKGKYIPPEFNTISKRNRSINPLSHILDGSNTLKKSTAKFYTNDLHFIQ